MGFDFGVSVTISVLRLSAFVHPEHRASCRVLEKCGFVRDTSSARRVQFPNQSPGLQQDVLGYALVLEPATDHAG